MSKVYDGIDEALTCFIAAQHAFLRGYRAA
jgi:hypothetical protein